MSKSCAIKMEWRQPWLRLTSYSILGWFHCATRMHFSRMHTACCSGRPSAAPHHTCPPTMHASLPCMPHLLPYMPSVMHASLPCMPPPHCHACPRACPLQCMSPATHPPTMHAPPPTIHATPATHAPATHTPSNGQTDTCENIAFANFVCGRIQWQWFHLTIGCMDSNDSHYWILW